jgi:hypothetical protein
MSTNQNNIIKHTGAVGSVPNALNPLTWQHTFIKVYRETLSIAKACTMAGVTRPTVQKYLRIDAEFNERFEWAKKDAADDLKESAFERAKNGSVATKTTYDRQGNVTSESSDPRYETALTIKFLEATSPEEFRPPTRLEHTGANGGPIEIVETKRMQLTVSVQNGLNAGMSLSETLTYLTMRGVSPDDLKLVNGSDLEFPDVSNAIDVTSESDE